MPLAKDKVRHVGEPVAMVVAESRYVAEDAADNRRRLRADRRRGRSREGPRRNAPDVHDDLAANVAAHVHRRRATTRPRGRRPTSSSRAGLVYDHGGAAAMENRGVVAAWDGRARSLTIWDTTQAPIPMRNGLAAMLGLTESQVRVIAPFVGGGFGPKIMMFYPEEVPGPVGGDAARLPVKWIEDRGENFVATTQERGQIHDAEIALTKRRPDPRHQGRVPARQRRLQPLRPDRTD